MNGIKTGLFISAGRSIFVQGKILFFIFLLALLCCNLSAADCCFFSFIYLLMCFFFFLPFYPAMVEKGICCQSCQTGFTHILHSSTAAAARVCRVCVFAHASIAPTPILCAPALRMARATTKVCLPPRRQARTPWLDCLHHPCQWLSACHQCCPPTPTPSSSLPACPVNQTLPLRPPQAWARRTTPSWCRSGSSWFRRKTPWSAMSQNSWFCKYDAKNTSKWEEMWGKKGQFIIHLCSKCMILESESMWHMSCCNVATLVNLIHIYLACHPWQARMCIFARLRLTP